MRKALDITKLLISIATLIVSIIALKEVIKQ